MTCQDNEGNMPLQVPNRPDFANTAARRLRYLYTITTTVLTLAALALPGCASQPRPIDTPRAVLRAASQGNPRSELNTGLDLLARSRTESKHAARDRAAGVKWIQRAARGNLAIAQTWLGRMYLNGDAVPQNTALALKWLHRGAARGAPAAQMLLGNLYAAGRAVPLDDAQAYYWYSVAAKPVLSDVNITNIDEVRAIARRRVSVVAAALTPVERSAVDRQIAAWQPMPSVPYNGTYVR